MKDQTKDQQGQNTAGDQRKAGSQTQGMGKEMDSSKKPAASAKTNAADSKNREHDDTDHQHDSKTPAAKDGKGGTTKSTDSSMKDTGKGGSKRL